MLLAGVAAALIVGADAFGDVVRYVCVGLIALCALAVYEEYARPGGGWWILFAAGAFVSAAGAALALVAETAGGIVAIVGAALVVVAAVIGWPMDRGADRLT